MVNVEQSVSCKLRLPLAGAHAHRLLRQRAHSMTVGALTIPPGGQDVARVKHRLALRLRVTRSTAHPAGTASGAASVARAAPMLVAPAERRRAHKQARPVSRD